MGMNLIVIFAHVLEFLILWAFAERLFVRKRPFWQALLAGAGLYAVCVAVFILFHNTILNTSVSAFAVFLFVFLFYNAKFKGAVLTSLFITLSVMATDLITMSALSFALNKDINVYAENELIFFLMVCLCKTLHWLVTRIAITAGIYLKGRQEKRFPLFLLLYPLCSMAIFYVLFVIAVEYRVSRTITLSIFIACIAILLSAVLTYIFYSRTSKQIDDLFHSQRELERVETDIAYYALLDRQNEVLKQLTHDEKNHLSTIKALANDPNVDTYIDSIYNEIRYHSMFGNTENKYLDLLLNKYQAICNESGIAFTVSVKTANLSFIEAADLITLLSNILDNAVDAAKDSRERTIELSVNRRNGFDVLTCTNSCDTPPLCEGKRLFTTKKSAGFHGLGVKSIEKTAAKYRGEFDWIYDSAEKQFIVNIAFFHQM